MILNAKKVMIQDLTPYLLTHAATRLAVIFYHYLL